MKKLLILTVFGMVLLPIIGGAYNCATTSDSSSGQTVTLVSFPGTLDKITVSNSESTPRRLDIWDSTTYIGSIVVPARDSRGPYRLATRIASTLKVFMEGAYMFVTAEYSGGETGATASGHYPYGVRDDVAMNTPYASTGDIIGVIVANWNTDTGASATIYDYYTAKARVNVPASDTKEFNFDRFRFNTNFNVILEKTNMSIMLIRREE